MRCRCAVLSALVFSLATCSPPPPPVVTSSDDVFIEYDVHGETGPTLVLVHGWSNNRTFWDPHIPRLSQEYQVVTVDLGGHGDSGTNRTAWTMQNFGQDVVAVIEALELDEVFLVGFSMGGAAVLEAANAIPDRVSGVVFVDVFQNPKAQYSEEYIQRWVNNVSSVWNDPDAMGSFIARDAPDSLKQRLLSLLPESPPDYWWEAVSNFFRWSNTDLTRLLQELSVPVAAINAASPSTDVAAIQEFAPSFSAKTIHDVGHIGVIWMKLGVFEEFLAETVSEMESMSGS